MIRLALLVLISTLLFKPALGQDERKMIRQGNQLYEDGNYIEAEAYYRQALESNSQDQRALFNLGNSLYRQGRYDEAANIFQGLAQMSEKEQDRASAWHNLGNSYLGNQQIAEGIEAYKNALRIDPESDDTRYNLAYAMNLLQDPPPEEQHQDGDDDGEADEQPQDQPQQNEDQQPEDQQQQQQAHPDQLTLQDAERILDALNQQEQSLQEEINKEERQQVPSRVEKEW